MDNMNNGAYNPPPPAASGQDGGFQQNSQPPVYPPPSQYPPQQTITPPKNHSKILVPVIVAIIAVVVILAMILLMASPLLGTWDMESMTVIGLDISASGGYVRFSMGGKGEMGMPNHLTGVMDITDIEWKDIGEDQVRITELDSGDSNIYDYTVEGNTLTLTRNGISLTYTKR